MTFHFWSFVAGGAAMLGIQWALLIPYHRRHKVVMALLHRAKMYKDRAIKHFDEGRYQEGETALNECKTLLAQAEELSNKNHK